MSFAFAPFGATTNLSVTASAQSLTLPTGSAPTALAAVADLGVTSYVLTNIGTQTVFIRCDGTTATTSNAMPLLAGTQCSISLPKSVKSISVIAAATGSTLYVTVGAGE